MKNTNSTSTTSKRNLAFEKLNNYKEYATSTNCYVKPQKGTNSGSDGRLLEISVKMCLNNIGFKGIVANAGKIDTTKKINGKMCKFEIKSGCGTLATLDRNGNIINSELLKSDYIIYCPEYINTAPVSIQCYVLPIQSFLNVLENCNLLRYKYSGQQYTFNENGEKVRKADAYHDKLTIQTFNNSRRKADLFYTLLEENSIRLDKFCISNNIKYNKEI